MKHAEVLPPPSEYDGEITDAGRHTTYEVERDCTSKFKRTSVLSTAWEQGWRHTTLKVKASAALITRTHTIKTNDACERARIGRVRMGDDGTRPCMRWPSPSHSVAATVMSNPDNEYLMGLATVVVFLTVALPGRQGTFVRCDRAGRTRLQTSTNISNGQVHRTSWPVSRPVDSSHGDLRKRMNFFLISEDLITRSLIIDKTIQATPPDRYRVLMGLQRSCSWTSCI